MLQPEPLARHRCHHCRITSRRAGAGIAGGARVRPCHLATLDPAPSKVYASPTKGRWRHPRDRCMIIALLALIAVGVVFIALQTRREGTPVIRPGFLFALAAVVIVGILLALLPR
jgi:hypothetical protein